MLAHATLVLAALLASSAGAQTLYKSVGPDGRIIYTDRPPVEGKIQKTLRVEDLPNTALPAKTLAELKQLQSAGQTTAWTPTASVVLFSASWCGYCRQARAYLSQKKVEHQEIDIDSSSGKAAFVQAGGVGGIPLLVANGQRLRGFNAAAYDTLFARR